MDFVILLAEDDEHDVFLLRNALERVGVTNPLFVAEDGREAIRYLAGEGKYADRSRHPEPGLLITDLKMPGMDGFELLAWIQSQPRWKDNLGLIVWSSSGLFTDKKRVFDLGAHEFVEKPAGLDALMCFAEDLKRRWLSESADVKTAIARSKEDQPHRK